MDSPLSLFVFFEMSVRVAVAPMAAASSTFSSGACCRITIINGPQWPDNGCPRWQSEIVGKSSKVEDALPMVASIERMMKSV